MPDDLSTALPPDVRLPERRALFYGGAWNDPVEGGRMAVSSPATAKVLGDVALAGAADVDAAVTAAREGFERWRRVAPLDRARTMCSFAAVLREHARELALIDALDGGNPLKALLHDLEMSANGHEFFAGLVTEMKGSTVPMGEGVVNYTAREPWGVVAKIIPFNHPIMFATLRAAAPLAAGNAVIVKTPDQAPLSALRLMEIAGDHFPPGVFNVLSGGREAGAALVAHPGVDKVSLIGSVEAGRAVLRGAADRIKPVLLELGGKNALVADRTSDPAKVAAGLARGMNSRLPPRRDPRRGGGGVGTDRLRRAARPAHAHGDGDGQPDQRRAPRPCVGLHRFCPRRGRHASNRRRRARRPGAGARLLRQPHRLHQRAAVHADRAGGDLRPRSFCAALGGRSDDVARGELCGVRANTNRLRL